MIYADGEMQSAKLAFDQYMRDCFSADIAKLLNELGE